MSVGGHVRDVYGVVGVLYQSKFGQDLPVLLFLDLTPLFFLFVGDVSIQQGLKLV